MKSPIVTISCITYNHEKFIAQAIEGFLMQKTNFEIEILIHDDASTDNTASIIREYEKNDSRIKVIYQSENQFSKGVKPSLKFLWPIARGKYIALCEGDDYWTDPYKLQKQVDFLEANEEYGLVHTDAQVKFEINNRFALNETPFLGLTNNEVKEKLLIGEYRIYTCTALFRKSILDLINFDEGKKFKMGDFFLWNHFAQLSSIAFLPDITAVRRIIPESASQTTTDFEKMIQFWYSVIDMGYYFRDKFSINDATFEKMIKKYYSQVLHYYFLAQNPKKYREVYAKILKQYGKNVINEIDRLHYIISFIPFSFYISRFIRLKVIVNKIIKLIK